MKNKTYSNGDFSKDLKRAHMKPAKKRKTAMVSPFKPVKVFTPKAGVGNNVGSPTMGGTTQSQMNSAMNSSKVLMKKNKKSKAKGSKKKTSGKKRKTSFNGFDNENGTSAFDNNKDLGYMDHTTPALTEGQMSTMKIKSSKKKGAKKKVSHVLQESSMCKECKTSHKPGKHSVKKKS